MWGSELGNLLLSVGLELVRFFGFGSFASLGFVAGVWSLRRFLESEVRKLDAVNVELLQRKEVDKEDVVLPRQNVAKPVASVQPVETSRFEETEEFTFN